MVILDPYFNSKDFLKIFARGSPAHGYSAHGYSAHVHFATAQVNLFLKRYTEISDSTHRLLALEFRLMIKTYLLRRYTHTCHTLGGTKTLKHNNLNKPRVSHCFGRSFQMSQVVPLNLLTQRLTTFPTWNSSKPVTKDN